MTTLASLNASLELLAQQAAANANNIGDLTTLNTAQKGDLVKALNGLQSEVNQLGLDAITATDVQNQINQAKTDILGGAPSTTTLQSIIDTINGLSAEDISVDNTVAGLTLADGTTPVSTVQQAIEALKREADAEAQTRADAVTDLATTTGTHSSQIADLQSKVNGMAEGMYYMGSLNPATGEVTKKDGSVVALPSPAEDNDSWFVKSTAAHAGYDFGTDTGGVQPIPSGAIILSDGHRWTVFENEDVISSVNNKVGAVVLNGTDINHAASAASKLTATTVGGQVDELGAKHDTLNTSHGNLQGSHNDLVTALGDTSIDFLGNTQAAFDAARTAV